MDKTYVVGSVRESGNSVRIEIITPSGDVKKIRMTAKLWAKYAFASADVIGADAFSEILHVGECCEAVTRALRLIADAPYSYRSLEIKLKRSGFSEYATEYAMTSVRRRGLIDEDAQARYAAEKYAKRNLRGPARIKSDLMAHGYPADVAARAAESIPDEIYEEALEKNIVKKGVPEDKKAREKLAASLVRLGFPVTKILKKLNSYEQ